MRLVWFVLLSLLAVLTLQPPVQLAASEPVFTNKPRFRIPFRFDAAEMQRLHPREIQLFVSQDGGSSWQHAQSANPNAGRFDFEATHDEEYWFAVKTLDVQNRLYPRDNAEPGLKVIVDTTRPTLDVTLREVSRGKVQLSWNADDAHIDPTTLRLEYMQSGSTGWQQVSVVPQASGQTTWSVPQGGFVAIRGMVSDLAGNIGQAESQIKVGAGGDTNPGSEDREYREPVASGQPSQDPFAPLPGFGPTAPRTDSRTTPAAPTKPDARANVPNQQPSFSATARGSAPGEKLISDSPETRPEVIERRVPKMPEPAAKTGGKPVLKQVVNSRNFQIGYRIDGAESSGVSAVELYLTQDGGGRWLLYGEDTDRQSPFSVTVPTDGEYGFELRVRNANGLSTEPPKTGDRPSIVVTVDQTPPVAQLLPVQIGQGANPSELLIQWEVRDDHLGMAPISLACAPSPGGPWRQIGDWQPNSGRLFWSPDLGLPQKFYLRLTARDEAGNTTEVASPEAVIVNLPKPLLRIRGVEAPSSLAKPY